MKKGQIQLSVGMIFSIIIIIATVALAIYLITSFLSTSNCAQINLFRSDFQGEVDNVWKSAQAQKTFQINLPTKITKICLGNLSSADEKYRAEFLELRRYQDFGYNLFILPSLEACGGNSALTSLKHIEDLPFTCINLAKGKANLKLIKESTSQNLVKISTSI